MVEWVERTIAGRVVSARRTFGGGSRFTWLVDVERSRDPGDDAGDDDGATELLALVLRVESGHGAFAGTALTLQREAVVYRALQGRDVRIPTLFGVAPDGGALLMARAPGTADFDRLSAVDAQSALEDFVDVLAILHRIPVETLSLPGFAIPTTPEEHALNELDAWEQMVAQRCPDVDPEIAYALSWLRANVPIAVARTSLVQGDTGPGNFVVDGGAVSAVIDWEFAHVGDPVDDIAWFVFRISGKSTTSAAQIETLLRRYEAGAGFAIDRSTLAYYRVFVQLRCAVTTAMTIAHGGGAMGVSGYRVAHSRFVRQCLQAIADATGAVVEQPVKPCATGTPRSPFFDEALAEIDNGLIPALRGEAKLRARSARTLLAHLRARDMVGDQLDHASGDDMHTTFAGEQNDTARISAMAASAGNRGDVSVLACLLRRAIRNEWLWSGAFEVSKPLEGAR